MPATIPADVDRLFAEALSSGDLETAVACYETNAVYQSGDGETARGHDQIRAALADLIAQHPTLNCYEVDAVENGDLAVLRARWIYTGMDESGVAFEHRGRSIEVVRRQDDGTWKFTIDLPNGAS